jgi:histidinol-phosphate aminotransferase
MRRVGAVIGERARMEAELAAGGWGFTPSQGNFILVRPDIDPHGSSGAHEQLLRLGVIVRDGASLGCPGHLRVSVGTPEENDAFLAARARLAAGARQADTGRTPP